jgi:serine/threonine-protein kinase RsbT
MADRVRVQLRTARDVLAARRSSRDLCRKLGFGVADQTRLATAVSELARNVIQHVGEGNCVISDESRGDRVRARAVIEDHGQGIADLEAAMRDGFTTGGGLGAGLPGAKRLAHRFQVESRPGLTRVMVEMSKSAVETDSYLPDVMREVDSYAPRDE